MVALAKSDIRSTNRDKKNRAVGRGLRCSPEAEVGVSLARVAHLVGVSSSTSKGPGLIPSRDT